MIELRPYQQQMMDETDAAYDAGYRSVLNQLSTGGGKTILLADQAARTDGPSCTIVHRQELLSQISETYAAVELPHRIIAPQAVINAVIERHVRKFGRSFYDPRSQTAVAGVDTIIRRFDGSEKWCKDVRKWLLDESHHGLSGNKWGKAAALFPNAVGFGVTATPIRADKKSLHMDQGGLFDHLVQGPSMRWLIDQGALCDYRVVSPQSSIDEAMLRIGSTGDFTDASIKKAAKAELVGDVVHTYQDFTPGKQAIVFTSGVDQSREIADAFTAAGIRAEALDANTPDGERSRAVDSFGRGEIKVLVNTGLFDEGFDVPAVEVTIMARPTMSYGLFAQQIGRCLRPADEKTHGTIIDHVGNVLRMAASHGMPDTPRKWTLWRDPKQRGPVQNPDAIPMRTCESCGLSFEAITMTCPYCGHRREPEGRAAPEQVDGILAEMSPELLAQLRRARAAVEDDFVPIPHGAAPAVAARLTRLHEERQAAHRSLADVMEQWGGWRRAAGDTDEQMQARFLHRFGYDVLTAQTLKTADAIQLRDEINEVLTGR